jgi:ornithine cyclodeaminase/alanine dehydrogenase-like protein (mu-crystallin family)
MRAQIGSYTPEMREVHDDLIAAASLILVDSIPACSVEAGELIHFPKDRLVEVGYFSCSKTSQGRSGGNSVAIPRESYTVFKSVGVGVQDVAIAAFVVERGKEYGFGNVVSY